MAGLPATQIIHQKGTTLVAATALSMVSASCSNMHGDAYGDLLMQRFCLLCVV